MKVIEKNVMENTQVRFANISIKISDEFMQAVEEENIYHNNEYLVYSKKNNVDVLDASQTEKKHYSIEIPSKKIEDYNLLKSSINKAQSHNFINFMFCQI